MLGKDTTWTKHINCADSPALFVVNGMNDILPFAQSNQFLLEKKLLVSWGDECRIIKIISLIDNRLESSPIFDGIGSEPH
jgi:hypothetical protein